MKTYNVQITETLQMTVPVEAENAQAAEDAVRQSYKDSEYILDADHFAGVTFKTRAAEQKKTWGLNR